MKKTFAGEKINNPEIIRVKRNRSESSLIRMKIYQDLAFADVLNIDTTYTRISKDV